MHIVMTGMVEVWSGKRLFETTGQGCRWCSALEWLSTGVNDEGGGSQWCAPKVERLRE